MLQNRKIIPSLDLHLAEENKTNCRYMPIKTVNKHQFHLKKNIWKPTYLFIHALYPYIKLILLQIQQFLRPLHGGAFHLMFNLKQESIQLPEFLFLNQFPSMIFSEIVATITCVRRRGNIRHGEEKNTNSPCECSHECTYFPLRGKNMNAKNDNFHNMSRHKSGNLSMFATHRMLPWWMKKLVIQLS